MPGSTSQVLASQPKSYAGFCWKKPELLRFLARRLVRTARTSSVFRSRRRWKHCERQSNGYRKCLQRGKQPPSDKQAEQAAPDCEVVSRHLHAKCSSIYPSFVIEYIVCRAGTSVSQRRCPADLSAAVAADPEDPGFRPSCASRIRRRS